jgi:Domain of unknown function (DUF4190)
MIGREVILMSNIISTEPKPQAPQEPQAAPDGNAIASLILGIVGITILPFIGSILAVILGRASIGDAYKRGERGSAMATAGVILGWIGVAAPVIFFVLWFFTGGPLIVRIVVSFVILGLSALAMYYTRRNNRR